MKRILPFLALLLGCSVPTTPVGLACPDGYCPDGQVCGTDQICTYHHVQDCDPACESGFTCGTDGVCHQDGGGQDTRLDSRGAISSVIVSSGGTVQKCLGTLVAPSAVLTSASCVAGADSTMVRSDSGDLSVASTSVHPDFDPLNVATSGDVALLHLEVPSPHTAVPLSQTAPSGTLTAVVPASSSAEDRTRMAVEVLVGSVDGEDYSFSSPGMSQPPACPMWGGPSLDSAGQIVGVHKNTACAGGTFVDVRVDQYTSWIMESIAAATPESCDGFSPQMCADCGSTSCSMEDGNVVVACERDEDTYPCGDEQTCNQDLECVDDQPDTECEWNGGYNSRPCSECGQEWCLQDGTWSGACGSAWGCEDDEVCTDVGASNGYSSTWVCEPDEPAQCTTTAYNIICVSGDPAIPATVDEGDSWVTSEGCIDGCRLCTCGSDGNVTCSSCGLTPI